MPRNKNAKLTDEVLKKIEDKITKKIMNNIGNLIADKCEEIFSQKYFCENGDKSSELKINLKEMQEQIDALHYNASEILGSLHYISNEYDDFSTERKKWSTKIGSLVEKQDQQRSRLQLLEKQVDDLEQYGRRENLEIHGVPIMKGENTNQIVKAVAQCLNIPLSDEHISTSHRLPITSIYKSNQATEKSQNNCKPPHRPVHPPIIVRFTNRDKRNKIFQQKKLLRENEEIRALFGSASNVVIKENLTAYRKMLYNATNSAKYDLNYKFLWTSQGRILLRKNSESRIINVSSLSDLAKIGYVDPVKCTNAYFKH